MGGKGGGGVSGADLANWTPPAGSTPVPVFDAPEPGVWNSNATPEDATASNNVSSIDSFNASMAKANAEQAAYVASGYGATPAAAAASSPATGDVGDVSASPSTKTEAVTPDAPSTGSNLAAAITAPDPFTYTPPGKKLPSATTTQT